MVVHDTHIDTVNESLHAFHSALLRIHALPADQPAARLAVLLTHGAGFLSYEPVTFAADTGPHLLEATLIGEQVADGVWRELWLAIDGTLHESFTDEATPGDTRHYAGPVADPLAVGWSFSMIFELVLASVRLELADLFLLLEQLKHGLDAVQKKVLVQGE